MTTADSMSLSVALDFADNPRPHHTLAAPADTNGELYQALKVLATAYRSFNMDGSLIPVSDLQSAAAEILRLEQSLTAAGEREKHLRGLLREMYEMVKDDRNYQGREYVSLGIAVLDAIKERK